MSGLIHLIGNELVDRLIADCQTSIDESDPSRLYSAVFNALQDDPTKGVIARVYHHIPSSDRVDKSKLWEIGGGTFEDWYFTVKISSFLMKFNLTKEQALVVHSEVCARIKKCLKQNYPVLQDPFGNKLLFLKNYELSDSSGGGPPKDWIYRSELELVFQVYSAD